MDKIEIPFGAYDSETLGWTYTIPKGYTAKIEDGKIVVKKEELEDEKIRKSLVKFLKSLPTKHRCEYAASELENWLSWLEKQKEPKQECGEKGMKGPQEIGDWRGDEGVCKKQKEQKVDIDKLRRDIYQSGYNDGYQHGKEDAQKEQKPKFYPGDVIKCTSTGSLWVRCKDGDNIRSDGHTACIGGRFELASEEEVVQFFQELNENGYQWDCVKGRPMKKEQKPDDEYMERAAYNHAKQFESNGDFSKLYDTFRAGYFYAHRNSQTQNYKEPEKYSKGFVAGHKAGWRAGQKYVFDNLYLFGLCKPAEWSEEDKKMLLSIINAFRNGTVSTIGQEQWLKSLPERFNLQLKQEWSEEDKGLLLNVKCIIDEVWHSKDKFGYSEEELKEMWNWLDAAWQRLEYPISSWKPSEEQMEVLKKASTNEYLSAKQFDILVSLYEQLKKL